MRAASKVIIVIIVLLVIGTPLFFYLRYTGFAVIPPSMSVHIDKTNILISQLVSYDIYVYNNGFTTTKPLYVNFYYMLDNGGTQAAGNVHIGIVEAGSQWHYADVASIGSLSHISYMVFELIDADGFRYDFYQTPYLW